LRLAPYHRDLVGVDTDGRNACSVRHAVEASMRRSRLQVEYV